MKATRIAFPAIMTVAALSTAWPALEARAADSAPAAPAKGGGPVSLEPSGTPGVKRITLTAKAAERLDVQTGSISEQVVIRKQTVSGMVIYPQAGGAGPGGAAPAAAGKGGFGSFGVPGDPMKKVALTEAAAPAAPVAKGESWVVVNLSPGEFERIGKDKPARITPLYTRDKGVSPMTAMLSDTPPVEDAKRSMLGLHYKLPDSSHGLAPSTRVRVELQLAGPEDKQKVVPYSAVYYDSKGQSWVYVTGKPLTYERQPVKVERVVGPLAVLAEGPGPGTQVVTVGAALLYGTEIFGK